MKSNFQIKLLSWRQFTVLRELHKKRMLVEDAVALYKSTVTSLANRGYLQIDWNQDVIELSSDGLREMEAFLNVHVSALRVKNNPESRQEKFRNSLPHTEA